MKKMNPYLEYCLDVLSIAGHITWRAMFGGYGLYRDGIIFGIIVADRLYFKVGEHNKADFEFYGMKPFTYTKEGKSYSMSYYEVPETVLEDGERLRVFVDNACSVTRHRS